MCYVLMSTTDMISTTLTGMTHAMALSNATTTRLRRLVGMAKGAMGIVRPLRQQTGTWGRSTRETRSLLAVSASKERACAMRLFFLCVCVYACVCVGECVCGCVCVCE